MEVLDALSWIDGQWLAFIALVVIYVALLVGPPAKSEEQEEEDE